MADKTNRRQTDDVYWPNIAVDSGEDDAYIPGLSAPGNKRPGRVRAKKMKEVKAKIPSRQPIIESNRAEVQSARNGHQTSRTLNKGKPKKPLLSNQRDSMQSFPFQEKSTIREDSGMSTTFESFAEKSIRRLQQVSLKDLRPEDKQRVANLIKELARVGEEKEKAVKELHGERQQYEQQLVRMVEQQETILKEREDVQEKLFQCQKLLTEYQNQLLNKQDRLNSSITEMREAIEDKKSVAKTTHKPTETIEVCPFTCNLSDMDERSLTVVSYNRSVSPIDRQDDIFEPQYHDRQTRDRRVTRRANENMDDRLSANQNTVNNCDNQDESVSDLLLNPAETIKRPYTSMIDKEIAMERSRSRSLSQGSRGSSSSRPRSVSPSGGRPKFAYPQTINGIGPLKEPLASSTQKSMEMTSQYENETLRSKISAIGQGHHVDNVRRRAGHVKGQATEDSERVKSKVVFNDEDEYNDSTTVHSPNLKSASQMFNDPAYASYYKKLSPGGRKKELLKQRQSLLDEQERLRKVLEKQEQQLSHRKYEYDKRVELQKQRMDFYKEGGKFPALKLDFESGSDRGSGFVEDTEKGKISTGHSSHAEMYSPPPTEDIEIDNEIQVKSRVSMGTSPISTPRHGNRITVATSPVLSQDSDDTAIPKLVDVATSISYRTPTNDNSDRLQGNLALGCNRQRMDINISVPTPGEKTLNVLELVNSMEEEPFSPHQPFRNRESAKQPMRKQERIKQPIREQDDQENQPIKVYTPNKYITDQKEKELSPFRQKSSPATRKILHGKHLNDEEESMEENQILEDIFFL